MTQRCGYDMIYGDVFVPCPRWMPKPGDRVTRRATIWGVELTQGGTVTSSYHRRTDDHRVWVKWDDGTDSGEESIDSYPCFDTISVQYVFVEPEDSEPSC